MTDHRIPAIDRAVEILDQLAAASGPMVIRQLATATNQARSTVYRTLNTLEEHGLVRRVDETGYVLGVRLLKLARAVPQGVDLVAIARPVLEALATELGTSAKLSIVDGNEALVVAVVESPGTYSITTQIGRRFPLHAGAASKLLLAFLPHARRTAYLACRLSSFTAHTITDPKALNSALNWIRETGFAEDRGEYADGVRAFASAVRDTFGDCIGAVSVPFVDTDDESRAETIKASVIRAGDAISRTLGS